MLETPPLSLYVHLPWCVRKCPYCDFNSYGLKGALPEEQYIDALERDLTAQAEEVAGRPIRSVFFGGGTPSLFSPAAIGRFIASSRRTVRFAPDVEITLEANPGTVERGRFAEYRAAGVNRVSLGAQSFDPQQLAALGRIHSAAETCRAAEELHAAGLARFNLDLMYGLPGQDVAGAAQDVEVALRLEPAHISHYQLTIEPHTAFAAHPPKLPEEDVIDLMLTECQARLSAAGFARYEVSAYARRGMRCRHNLNYWQFGDYVGVGAGAHGKLTDAHSGRIVRSRQQREPRRYLVKGAQGVSRTVTAAEDLPFEFMMNALRLVEGFDLADFAQRTGLTSETVVPVLKRGLNRGLLSSEGQRWHATPLGMRFLNDVVSSFLPEKVQRTFETPLSTGSIRYAQAKSAATANEQITSDTR